MATVTDMINNSMLGSLIAKNNIIAQLINVPGIVASLGGAA